MKFDETP